MNDRMLRRRVAEALRLRGDLSVRLTHVKTGRQRTITVQNTITYDGIDSPLYLWAPDGVDPADYAFNLLSVGSNNTPPSRGDVGLYQSFLNISIANSGQRVRSTGQVEVRATISPGTSVGETIREFGIILVNNNLFARQTTPDIELTGLFTVDVRWRITVSA